MIVSHHSQFMLMWICLAKTVVLNRQSLILLIIILMCLYASHVILISVSFIIWLPCKWRGSVWCTSVCSRAHSDSVYIGIGIILSYFKAHFSFCFFSFGSKGNLFWSHCWNDWCALGCGGVYIQDWQAWSC